MKYPFGHCQKCGKPDTSINLIYCDDCNRIQALQWFENQRLNAEAVKKSKENEKLYYAMTTGITEAEPFH